jgi:type IV pilus assembly protein PilA
MLQHLHKRRQDETGFTLIELMVVVLIMGILMAIAIPTFLSTQGSANDASAKSNATNAFTGEKAYYEDNLVFLDASAAANSAALDSQLPWTNAAGSATTDTVTAQAGAFGGTGFVETTATPFTNQSLLIEDLSKSGNCFYIADDQTASPPVIAYAESVGCFANGSIAIPAQTPAAGANAGANIVPAATAALVGANWYASW